jgi:hypothetical protein
MIMQVMAIAMIRRDFEVGGLATVGQVSYVNSAKVIVTLMLTVEDRLSVFPEPRDRRQFQDAKQGMMLSMVLGTIVIAQGPILI